MVHLGIGGQIISEGENLYPHYQNDVIIDTQRMINMQKRDVVLTAVFSSLAALILITGIGAACYFFHKRRRKRDDDEEDGGEGMAVNRAEASDKKSKLNGFLSLKTPLISTKTLGEICSYPKISIDAIKDNIPSARYTK